MYYPLHHWELCSHVLADQRHCIAARESRLPPIKLVYASCVYAHSYITQFITGDFVPTYMQVKIDSHWLLERTDFPLVKRRYSWNVQFCCVIHVCVMDYWYVTSSVTVFMPPTYMYMCIVYVMPSPATDSLHHCKLCEITISRQQ